MCIGFRELCSHGVNASHGSLPVEKNSAQQTLLVTTRSPVSHVRVTVRILRSAQVRCSRSKHSLRVSLSLTMVQWYELSAKNMKKSRTVIATRDRFGCSDLRSSTRVYSTTTTKVQRSNGLFERNRRPRSGVPDDLFPDSCCNNPKGTTNLMERI